MGLIKSSLLVVLTAVLVRILPEYFFVHETLPENFGGAVDPQFKKVQETFIANFRRGWERDGAAFAAFYKGKLVVDLWGGYADDSSARPWTQDTMALSFSSTKAVSALCVAMLVDRGFMDYDALVTKYWPEFGKHGKGNVTVKMLMAHQAGVAVIDESIEREDVSDWKRMARILENQKPNWPPGTRSGYHAITYGWLVDQLVRRSDPQGRSLGQFLREEIALPYEIDYYIGLPAELEHRVVRLSNDGLFEVLQKLVRNRPLFYFLYNVYGQPRDSLISGIGKPTWLFSKYGRNLMNGREFHALEQGAVSGIGTARGLAKIFSLLIEKKLVNQTTIDLISQPVVVKELDAVMRLLMDKGWGFMFTRSPQEKRSIQFGHPGYGGQNVKVDIENKLAFAYSTNRLRMDMGDLAETFMALQKALYDSL